MKFGTLLILIFLLPYATIKPIDPPKNANAETNSDQASLTQTREENAVAAEGERQDQLRQARETAHVLAIAYPDNLPGSLYMHPY